MSNTGSLTLTTIHKIMEGLKRYSNFPIVQKILAESLDVDNKDGLVPLLEGEDQTTGRRTIPTVTNDGTVRNEFL
jgi:hypothetical protein